MFRKLFFILITLFFLNITPSIAQCSIEQVIAGSKLSQSAVISVSVKELKTQKEVYSKNSTLLLQPASTLKAFTTPVIINTLGNKYKNETKIYKSGKNLYIKIGADPNLTSEELNSALKKVKNHNYENIFIDDTISNDNNWGVGWLWDNNTNPLMPKYSAYNIDRNSVELDISEDKINIIPYYPLEIENTLTKGTVNLIKTEKPIGENPDKIKLSGSIASETKIIVPVENPKTFFIYRLKELLKENNISYCNISTALLPGNRELTGKITHKLTDTIKQINKNSDNFAIESLFLIIGNGKTKNGIEKFYRYYESLGMDTSALEIVDASGVSHNNLINTDWMSTSLCLLSKEPYFKFYLKSLAAPQENGTLKNRLADYEGKLQAKTGTLSGVSGLTGYLKASSGKTYAFAILIQNFKGSSVEAKKLENEIISAIYNSH